MPIVRPRFCRLNCAPKHKKSYQKVSWPKLQTNVEETNLPFFYTQAEYMQNTRDWSKEERCMLPTYDMEL